MKTLIDRISPNGLAALRALRDCRVIRTHWTNAGYEELRFCGLAVASEHLGVGMYNFILTERGKKFADRKFGLTA